MARTGRIGKGGHGRPRQSAVVSGFGNHPRIDLTTAKLVELNARKVSNTAEYQALKNGVDISIDAYLGGAAALSASLGTATSGTFAVDDGSAFPSGAHYVSIGTELITVSGRSGNTFTYTARGVAPPDRPLTTTTFNVSHASGAKVYEYKLIGNSGGAFTCAVALLDQMGVSGYDTKALKMLGRAMAFLAGAPTIAHGGDHDQDAMRSEFLATIRAYDWMYTKLGALEIVAYAEVLRYLVQDIIDNPHSNEPLFVQRMQENRWCSNVAQGTVIFGLLASAATYGDNTSAQNQWNYHKTIFTTYMLPGMMTGPFAHGVAPEGQEYSEATWNQAMEIVRHIAALDTDYWSSVDTWLVDTAKYLFHATPPGAGGLTTGTTGTMTAASSTMTVSSVGDFVVGDLVICSTNTFAVYEASIVGISGLQFTMSRVCPSEGITAQGISHSSHLLPYGDIADDWNSRFNVAHWREGHKTSVYELLDILKTRNPTYGGYVKYFIDTRVPAAADFSSRFTRFLYYDASVSGVDYTAVLTKNFVTTETEATGIVINRSDWTQTATYAWMLVGGRPWYHNHSQFNDLGILRKGAYLLKEQQGYSITGAEGPWAGARYHNSVRMNGHSALNSGGSVYDPASDTPGPPHLTRSELSSSYAYARGDASGPYTSTRWTIYGYLNNYAQTFVRDWFHINPDLIVIHDRMGYTNGTLSPTMWGFQYESDPTIASQRITHNNGGQTLVQDVVLPASATLTKTAQQPEDSQTRGYRIDIVSGVTATNEWGVNVFQCGNAGFSPTAVTTLTTTNANVVQIGALAVVGFVKDASPTLNITYVVVGSPTFHKVAGFAVSTAYHVTNVAGTITIAAATGSGDTTSSAAGILTIP